MTRIELFATDLDGTLLGNPEATRRFKDAWEALATPERPALVYASGRLVQDVIDLLATRVLPWPDFIIGGVGTQLYDARVRRALAEFNRAFRDRFDLARVEEIVAAFPGVLAQPPQFLHPYKSSWFLDRATPGALDELRARLAAAGLEVTVVYSSGRHLDVLPAGTDKGRALEWLCRRLAIPPSSVLVAGDTGNDASLFLLPGVRGIVVENAQPELIEAVVPVPTFNATHVLADGVLEGLRHFGVIPETPKASQTALRKDELDPTLRMLFTEAALGSLTSDERAVIIRGYHEAVATIRRNITPLGFSACSMHDNEVVGTDVNYRSVWARDGCLTVLGTMALTDPVIRAAQVATLRTLFDHLAPNGQVPANVRIDDGTPEYRGVGGICAVDSALWSVIAFHDFVRKTGDRELLAEYRTHLDRVMTWLLALDANNDLLLEIPEAGDWTDLFGRSYHVLYDEVLWYRASVAYGRLLELGGEFEAAAAHLRRAQALKHAILRTFWPSTANAESPSPHGFAQRQSSLGDTRYLIAEVTPFGFNWRCDVIGNIQAFLANILDVERARTAFRFMWGVGVNDPYPVVNLYPAVQSGDPDWRPYYTVNLLNLPGHYHNGGIWPFIGGMWVRFIHRLGLYEVAARELYRLALLNRLGRTSEWEFNEWVHSRTARPMGKRYQSWSASSFIHACHELQLAPEAIPED